MAAALQKFAMQADPGVHGKVCAISAGNGTQLPSGSFNIPRIEPSLRHSAGPV